MALRLAVASSAVWPPDRKLILGTAAGTLRRTTLTVFLATMYVVLRIQLK